MTCIYWSTASIGLYLFSIGRKWWISPGVHYGYWPPYHWNDLQEVLPQDGLWYHQRSTPPWPYSYFTAFIGKKVQGPENHCFHVQEQFLPSNHHVLRTISLLLIFTATYSSHRLINIPQFLLISSLKWSSSYPQLGPLNSRLSNLVKQPLDFITVQPTKFTAMCKYTSAKLVKLCCLCWIEWPPHRVEMP